MCVCMCFFSNRSSIAHGNDTSRVVAMEDTSNQPLLGSEEAEHVHVARRMTAGVMMYAMIVCAWASLVILALASTHNTPQALLPCISNLSSQSYLLTWVVLVPFTACSCFVFRRYVLHRQKLAICLCMAAEAVFVTTAAWGTTFLLWCPAFQSVHATAVLVTCSLSWTASFLLPCVFVCC